MLQKIYRILRIGLRPRKRTTFSKSDVHKQGNLYDARNAQEIHLDGRLLLSMFLRFSLSHFLTVKAWNSVRMTETRT
jgi:hypothetical protein